MKYAVILGIAAIGVGSLMTGAALAKAGHDRMPIAFEELDANSDGQLTAEELAAAKQKRFESIDSNGDGNLSADELQAHAAEKAIKRTEKMIERRDANGDGALSLEEMSRDDRAAKRFDRIDRDGDGVISKAEFDQVRDRMAKRHRN